MREPIHTAQNRECRKDYARIVCDQVSGLPDIRRENVAYDSLMLAIPMGIAAGKSKKIVSMIAAITTRAFAIQPSQEGTLKALSVGRTRSDLPLSMSNAHGIAKETICSIMLELIRALNAVDEIRYTQPARKTKHELVTRAHTGTPRRSCMSPSFFEKSNASSLAKLQVRHPAVCCMATMTKRMIINKATRNTVAAAGLLVVCFQIS